MTTDITTRGPVSDRRGFLVGAGAIALSPAIAKSQSSSTVDAIYNHVAPPHHLRQASTVLADRRSWPHWNAEQSIAQMSRHAPGILSYTVPYWWSSDKREGRTLARRCNTLSADIAMRRSPHFDFFASLPALADTAGCEQEIRYSLETLGARGIIVMSNYGDHWLDDMSVASIWDELDRRAATVFVQPSAPAAGSERAIVPLSYAAVQFDTAKAIERLRDDRMRWPKIRFLFASGSKRPPIGRVTATPVHTYWAGRPPESGTAWIVEPSVQPPAST
jgi:6-methylsalicylate decarboxylase